MSEKRDPNYKPRLRLTYQKTVIAALTKRFSYKNPKTKPRPSEGRSSTWASAPPWGNPKIIDSAVEDMRAASPVRSRW